MYTYIRSFKILAQKVGSLQDARNCSSSATHYLPSIKVLRHIENVYGL